MKKFAAAGGQTEMHLSLSAADMLSATNGPAISANWKNIMERAVLLAGEEGVILPQHLPRSAQQGLPDFRSRPTAGAGRANSVRFSPVWTSWKRAVSLRRYGRHGRAIWQGARELGLTDRIMALRMKKYGITYKEIPPETGSSQIKVKRRFTKAQVGRSWTLVAFKIYNYVETCYRTRIIFKL